MHAIFISCVPHSLHGLAARLAHQGVSVNLAAPSEAGLWGRKRSPHAFLVDLNEPSAQCLNALRSLRRVPRFLAVPALALVAGWADGQRLAAVLRAGADALLPWSSDSAIMAESLRALARLADRSASRTFPLAAAGMKLQIETRSVLAGERGAVRLSPKEFALLEALASRPGLLVTREDLMRTIRETLGESGSHVLETHISNLRRKLGPCGRHIRTIHRSGYALVP